MTDSLASTQARPRPPAAERSAALGVGPGRVCKGVYSRDMGRGNSREGVRWEGPWSRLQSRPSAYALGLRAPPPPSLLVLSGHAASLTPYQSDRPRPSPLKPKALTP